MTNWVIVLKLEHLTNTLHKRGRFGLGVIIVCYHGQAFCCAALVCCTHGLMFWHYSDIFFTSPRDQEPNSWCRQDLDGISFRSACVPNFRFVCSWSSHSSDGCIFCSAPQREREKLSVSLHALVSSLYCRGSSYFVSHTPLLPTYFGTSPTHHRVYLIWYGCACRYSFFCVCTTVYLSMLSEVSRICISQ